MAQKLGHARLAIPKINQNPRVAQHKALPPRKRALANAGAVKTPATSTAQPSNAAVPATQTTPVDAMANAPAASANTAAAAPSELFQVPAFDPNDPRDKIYWDNVAKLKFSDEQEYSKGLREQTRADTDYGDALQTAIRNRAVQQRGLGEDAIRGNLGASGWLDRTEGEQTTAYTQDRAHASRNKEEEDQARLAAREAIRQSFGIDLQTYLDEYGGRKTQQEREEALNAAPEVGAEAPGASSGGPGWQGDAPKGKGAGTIAPHPINHPKEAIGKRRRAR